MDRIFHNFPPSEFPDSVVDRYPSLTRALGNTYPGVRSTTPEDGGRHPPGSPSEPRGVPDPRPSAPSPPCIAAADQILSDRTSEASFKNSIWSNNSLSGSNISSGWNTKPHAPPHAVSGATPAAPRGGTPRILIPICTDTSEGPDPTVPSGSLGSPSLSPPCGSSTEQTCERAEIDSKGRYKTKPRQCSLCGHNFARPSQLETHSNTHTGDQPFACDSPKCSKKYGVRSNLRRHQCAIHNASSSGRGPSTKPSPPFKVEFAAPSLGPSVPSDASIPAHIAWDNEGPLSRQAVSTRASPEDTLH
ncbi:hypothetical protein C8R47DRAFT_1229146 [Mycena vitilis]|nr:hypothetical protein C8R47DRAFT_1229146 [Mycena vitilis]